jgi:hypothetical protein
VLKLVIHRIKVKGWARKFNRTKISLYAKI